MRSAIGRRPSHPSQTFGWVEPGDPAPPSPERTDCIRGTTFDGDGLGATVRLVAPGTDQPEHGLGDRYVGHPWGVARFEPLHLGEWRRRKVEPVGAEGRHLVVGFPRLEPHRDLEHRLVHHWLLGEVIAPDHPLVGGHRQGKSGSEVWCQLVPVVGRCRHLVKRAQRVSPGSRLHGPPGPAARRLQRQSVVDVLGHPPQLLAALDRVTAEHAKPIHLVPVFRRGQPVDQPKQLVGVVALDGRSESVGHSGGDSPGSSPVATGYPAVLQSLHDPG